jgi:hypothetical protein
VPGNEWLNVAMIRVNHKGKSMDAEDYATIGPGNVPEVVDHVKEVRKEGMGVISMKLIGEGTFNREDRQQAMKFAFRNAGVDCVTVGYKNTAEIEEELIYEMASCDGSSAVDERSDVRGSAQRYLRDAVQRVVAGSEKHRPRFRGLCGSVPLQ